MKKNRSKSMTSDFTKESPLEIRKRNYRRALQLYEQKRREQELELLDSYSVLIDRGRQWE